MELRKKNINKGFTLVELLVVISIIGILATVLLTAFRSSQTRSRDAQRKSDLKEISQALELFYSDHKVYPPADAVSGQILSCPWEAASPTACSWGIDKMEDDQDTTYFRILPADPIGDQNYFYRVLDEQAYQLYAHLENEEDRHCISGDCAIDLSELGIMVDCGGEGDNCNFAITSPNVGPTDAN